MRIVVEDGVCEDIDVERITDSRCRLLATPLFGSAKFGDVVELTKKGEIWRLERVVEPSPFDTFELLVTQEVVNAPEFAALLGDILRIGGEWERVFGGIIFLHLPPASVATLKPQIDRIIGLEEPA